MGVRFSYTSSVFHGYETVLPTVHSSEDCLMLQGACKHKHWSELGKPTNTIIKTFQDNATSWCCFNISGIIIFVLHHADHPNSLHFGVFRVIPTDMTNEFWSIFDGSGGVDGYFGAERDSAWNRWHCEVPQFQTVRIFSPGLVIRNQR